MIFIRLCRIILKMQEIVESQSFIRSAEIAKMTDSERIEAVNYISQNPTAGEIIIGSGGCRKVRIAGKGKGKSSGYRIITYYYDGNNPVYLWLVYAKNQSANLTKEQVRLLYEVTKAIKSEIENGR